MSLGTPGKFGLVAAGAACKVDDLARRIPPRTTFCGLWGSNPNVGVRD